MNYAFRVTPFMIVLGIFTSAQLCAQTKSRDYEIGINAGQLIYQGDLTSGYWGDNIYRFPDIGVYFRKPIDPWFSLRVNLSRGKIGEDESLWGNPSWKRKRNFSFSTPVTELSGVISWNFLGENSGENFHRLSPYVFAGLGVSFLHINRDWSKIDTAYFGSKSSTVSGLGIDTLHHVPGMIPVIPVGIGISYAITSNWSIYAEATYRVTFTDYLDGFSYAGNPSTKDHYYGIAVGISYHFKDNNGIKCPKWRR